MNWLRIQQETKLMARSRALVVAFVLTLVLSLLAVVTGLLEIRSQEQEIATLVKLDRLERDFARSQASDFGDAAYSTFYAVWNEPSKLAFAAIGQRDLSPVMMRIRALALEGQIYETDSINPELASIGRFDYGFYAAFILPLLAVFTFYDLISSEREAGRHALLVVTAGTPLKVWAIRTILRLIVLTLLALLPLWSAMILNGAGAAEFLATTAVITSQILLWSAIAISLGAFKSLNSGTTAAALVGIWMVLNIIVPLVGKALIETSVERNQGSAIALTQREVVNDAWDIPKSETMNRFFESHPEWSNTLPITDPFHWKWYFAFQQVGDEAAAPMVEQYRNSILQRDLLTARIALISPAVAVQRALQSIAKTDVNAGVKFEDRIRRYHEIIRKSYYPLLFNEVPFERSNLTSLNVPDFLSVR